MRIVQLEATETIALASLCKIVLGTAVNPESYVQSVSLSVDGK